MHKGAALRGAGLMVLGLLAVAVVEALGHQNFVYGLGLSIACNIGVLAFIGALFGSYLAIDPLCKYFKLDAQRVHWSIKALFVFLCVMATIIVIPRPSGCPSNEPFGDEY